ncbi:MAG: quaternary amine ABC transporter ATP-binding protein [Spirochaetota bacterium]
MSDNSTVGAGFGADPSSETNGSTPEEEAPIVRIESVWKVFGPDPKGVLDGSIRTASKTDILAESGHVLALRDINLEVKPGEFYVIMGLSGSGKSTLIRVLERLIEPTAGHLYVNDEDVLAYGKDKLSQYRKHTVSMVFQHFGLLPHYTVLQNAAYGLKARGENKQAREAKALEVLETVGLKGWEDYFPSALSGGMQQRVGIARALATDPQILLMDEPFSGLDPLIRRQMQDELVDLQGTLRKTIIFVTHDLHEALKLGDRIAIMRNGEVIQIGTPEEIVAEPADDYVEEFVQDASPARVFAASSIMQDPQAVVYRWQGPSIARRVIIDADRDWAFVLDRNRLLKGIVRLEDVQAHAKGRGQQLTDIIRDEALVCSPDAKVEDLFPLVSNSSYAVAVVDDEGHFLGEVRPRRIFEVMSKKETTDA